MAGAEVIELLLSWIVTNALTFAVVVADERWMSEERRERAWPPVSRDAAIIAFGVLALPVHFVRTRGRRGGRRSALGLLLGLFLGVVAVVVVALASGLVLTAVAWILGIDPID